MSSEFERARDAVRELTDAVRNAARSDAGSDRHLWAKRDHAEAVRHLRAVTPSCSGCGEETITGRDHVGCGEA